MVGQFETDPGTEKAREELKERIKKIREEKKEEEKKEEERRMEDEKLEELISGSDIALVDNTVKVHGFDQKI